MSNFNIILNEDAECHFKTAIKAFDPDSKVTYNKDGSYSVETKISIQDLKSLTSVKKVVDLDITSDQPYQGYYGGGWDSGTQYLRYADM